MIVCVLSAFHIGWQHPNCRCWRRPDDCPHPRALPKPVLVAFVSVRKRHAMPTTRSYTAETARLVGAVRITSVSGLDFSPSQQTHLNTCCARLYVAVRSSGFGVWLGPGLSTVRCRVMSYERASFTWASAQSPAWHRVHTLNSSDPTIFSPLFAASGSGRRRRACLLCQRRRPVSGRKKSRST